MDNKIKLYPHQETEQNEFIASFASNTQYRKLWNMDMGTGKTTIALTIIDHIIKNKQDYNILIICQCGVIKNWTMHLSEALSGINFTSLIAGKKDKDKCIHYLLNKGINIVNYDYLALIIKYYIEEKISISMKNEVETLKNLKETMIKLNKIINNQNSSPQTVKAASINLVKAKRLIKKYEREMVLSERDIASKFMNDLGLDLIIVDESHKIKDHTTKRFHYLRYCKSKHVCLLTGTPIEKSELNLWAQFEFMEVNAFGNFYSFRSNYFDKNSYNFTYTLKDSMRNKFNSIVAKHMVVVKMDEVVQLPPKIYKNYTYGVSERQLAEIQKIESSDLLAVVKSTKYFQLNSQFLFSDDPERTPIFVGDSKYELLHNIIKDQLEKKPIIWYVHIPVREKLIELLNLHGITFTLDDWEGFNYHSKYQVFLGSLGKFSEGIQLFNSSLMVYFELPRSSTSMIQSIARAHRINQTRKLIIAMIYDESPFMSCYRKVLQGTLDDKLNKIDFLNASIKLYRESVDYLFSILTWNPDMFKQSKQMYSVSKSDLVKVGGKNVEMLVGCDNAVFTKVINGETKKITII